MFMCPTGVESFMHSLATYREKKEQQQEGNNITFSYLIIYRSDYYDAGWSFL